MGKKNFNIMNFKGTTGNTIVSNIRIFEPLMLKIFFIERILWLNITQMFESHT